MEARRANVDITYNGAAITTRLFGKYSEFTYTDPASGEADSVDIALNDRDHQWITAWLPTKGDTLTAAIETQNWDKAGERRSLQCGFFTLDDYNFTGWPLTGTLSGVSVPADSSFRETERTRNWENITIQEIGKEIAKRAGIELVWDVDGEPIAVKSVEQSKKTDCDFYAELCKTYGLATKVYARKIVVYDREAYKAKAPVAKISVTEREMETMSWHTSLTGTYTGGEYTYTDPTTEEEIKVSVGTGTRILKKNGKADSLADAERKIKAEVANANHSATTMSVTIPGMIDIVASSCVTVVGVGRLSGKYFVDKVTSHVSASGGYTMDLELSLVDNMTEEVIKDAIQRLVAVGVINTPAYWEQHYMDNFFLFARNKKKLHAMVEALREHLLEQLGLAIKDDWQVYRFEGENRRAGKVTGRAINCLGFVIHNNRVCLRKTILKRIRGKALRMHRKRRCRRIDAAAIISYLGYLQHSDTYNYYKRHIKPNVSVQYCKRRISALAKKSNKEARKAT